MVQSRMGSQTTMTTEPCGPVAIAAYNQSDRSNLDGRNQKLTSESRSPGNQATTPMCMKKLCDDSVNTNGVVKFSPQIDTFIMATPEASDDLNVSHHSNRSGSTGSKFSSKQLRGNLTRTQTNRDPLQFYEITQVLGMGSMGSVAKVRKRESAIGGSARQSVQERVKMEHKINACFSFPLLGGFFQYCLKAKTDAMLEDITNRAWSTDSSTITCMKDGIHRKDMVFAMKSIHLSRITDQTFAEELKNEIEILKSLDHPYIVKAIETFDHRNQLFVIMELCSGGDLYSRDPYTEEEAARIVSAILGAIVYMHSRGILHRDLKYENILFADESPRAEIKLIDFGLSKMFGNDELTDGVGTIYTMAPEVLKGKYTKQADLWSIGVIAYMLMSSQMPFYGRKREHIVEQIMSGRYTYKGRRWKRISKQGKAFIDDLLVVDPDERATPDDVMRASWLNRRFSATVRSPHIEERESAKSSIVKFANYSKLRKVTLMVIAHKSTSAEIGILRKIFQEYDVTGCGQLSYDQFKAALNQVGYTDEEYRKIFDAVDLDGTGFIRYTEFLAASIEAQGAISEERLAEAFDRLDSDDSGYISAANLREILGDDFPLEEIEEIIKETPTSKNGMISYAEFLLLWDDKRAENYNKSIQEIHVLKKGHEASEDLVSVVSALSYEESDNGDTDEFLARSSFIDSKSMSERKISELTDSERKSDRLSLRRVMFQEDSIPVTDSLV